jgi:hypothetical protein
MRDVSTICSVGVGIRPRRQLNTRARAALAVLASVAATAGLVLVAPIGPSAASSGGLGGLDPSFGTTAQPGIGAIDIGSSSGNAIALDAAGNGGAGDAIVVAGASGALMAAGVLDSSGAQQSSATIRFAAGAAVATATAVDSSGDIVVAGAAGSSPAIAYLSSNGANLNPIASFGGGGTGTYTFGIPGGTGESGSFSALVPVGANVYAIGTYDMNGSAFILVARFTSAGLDTANFNAPLGYVLVPFPAGGLLNSAVSAAVLDTATPNHDLVVAGWLDVPAPGNAACTDDEAFLGGLSQAGATDGTFASGNQWFITQPNPTACANTTFNALAIDDSASTGGSGDIIAAGSESAAGVSPNAAKSSSQGLLAEYAPQRANQAGFSLNASFAKSAGGAGLLAVGGAGGVNEFDAVGLLPNATAPADPGVLVAGQEWSSSVEAFLLPVQKYDLNGVADDTFGSSGSTLLPCQPVISGCGAALEIQPTGAIEVAGSLDAQTTGAGPVTTGLAVAQLSDRSVALQAPGPTVSDSGSGSSPAVFLITVSSPSDPNLTGLPNGLPVQFTTQNGTGRSGANYTQVSGTVIFPCPQHNQPAAVTCAGASNPNEATITVPTAYPANATGSATFSLVIVKASGASISVSTSSATITYPPQQGAPPVPTTLIARGGATSTTQPKPPTTPPAAGKGYWIVSSAGSVFAYGDAFAYGSVSANQLAGASVVTIAATQDALGYWLVSSSGQVYAFGDAKGHGSVGKKRLSGSIIAFAANANGQGYWMVSSTGRVYAFGTAHNYGSVRKKQLAGTVTAFALARGGKGYWVASSAGPVYAFGDARKLGGLPLRKRTATVVAISASAGQRGYWLLMSSGRVYAYGKAHNYGSVPRKLLAGSAVSLVPTPDFAGYWITSSQGGVYTFGDAKSYGSPAEANVTSIIGAATT